MDYPSQIAVQDAIDIIEREAPEPRSERVDLARAQGRTLARPLASRADHPTLDNSALDGYACRYADTVGAGDGTPLRLAIVGEVPAGRPSERPLQAGEAVRIYTGGALPEGSDAIVRVEVTQEQGSDVLISEEGDRGAIRRRAQDLQAGIRYLDAGVRLDAGALTLAAAMGHDRVDVARPPRVALLTTGDEVIAPGGALAPGQVYDSNASSVAALARLSGAEVTQLPRVHDSVDALEAALAEAGDVDLLLTSGGVSMGAYDIVRDLLFDRGEVLFWKVAMKPGGPALFGRWRGLPILGLPGNPVSSMVVFLLLGAPFVYRALGSSQTLPYRRRVVARTSTALRASSFKETFQRVRLGQDGPVLTTSTTGSQSSGIVRSMREADALAVLPPHATVAAGDTVDVIPLAPFYG
jgi:molybdopterin molybdotransferase